MLLRAISHLFDQNTVRTSSVARILMDLFLNLVDLDVTQFTGVRSEVSLPRFSLQHRYATWTRPVHYHCCRTLSRWYGDRSLCILRTCSGI